jgi:NAD(P)-dependent dehydrogenase (short-subunit alcohol dehydrogenase family)
VAIELAKEGCNVLIVGRDRGNLLETKSKTEEYGVKCEILEADLSLDGELKNLVEEIKKRNYIDILCNIAGVWHSDTQPFFDILYKDFSDKVITDSLNVGIKASMLLSKAVIPLMRKNGRIINTSGTFGKGEKDGVWEKGCMADLVTKKAIEIFTKQLAYELEGSGITVNVVCPWYVWTENVQKFYPEVVDEAIPVNNVARHYIDTLKSEKNGEIIEIREKF